MEDLDKLFAQLEINDKDLKPLLEEQKALKELVKTKLGEINLDSYSAGRVVATSFTTKRVSYPVKELVEIVPEALLKKVRVESESQSLRISIKNEK